MIIVTEEAKSELHALTRASLPEGRSLRLETARSGATKDGDRVVMSVEEPQEGDEPVEYEGVSLMYVSRRVSASYDGCVVDLEHTPEGIAFSIGPPLAGLDTRS